MTRDVAEMRMSAYVPMLMQRFPDAAFTAESLEFVAARAVKGFPTYGELAEWLGEWWRPRRPPLVAALPPPAVPIPRQEVTPEQREAIHARVAAAIAHLTASRSEADAEHPPPRARYLSDGVLDQLNPLPNGRKRVTGAAA